MVVVFTAPLHNPGETRGQVEELGQGRKGQVLGCDGVLIVGHRLKRGSWDEWRREGRG